MNQILIPRTSAELGSLTQAQLEVYIGFCFDAEIDRTIAKRYREIAGKNRRNAYVALERITK